MKLAAPTVVFGISRRGQSWGPVLDRCRPGLDDALPGRALEGADDQFGVALGVQADDPASTHPEDVGAVIDAGIAVGQRRRIRATR